MFVGVVALFDNRRTQLTANYSFYFTLASHFNIIYFPKFDHYCNICNEVLTTILCVCRLIINDCLDSGTQLPYIERALRKGWGVLVMNRNDNSQVEVRSADLVPRFWKSSLIFFFL